jgi:hypothetical protein
MMPTEPESSDSTVSVLDNILADLDLVRACLGELRRPDAALVPAHTLVERAESCLDDVCTALRRLRVRVADQEPGP